MRGSEEREREREREREEGREGGREEVTHTHTHTQRAVMSTQSSPVVREVEMVQLSATRQTTHFLHR